MPKVDGQSEPPRDERKGDDGARRGFKNRIVEDSLEVFIGQFCQHERLLYAGSIEREKGDRSLNLSLLFRTPTLGMPAGQSRALT